LIPDRIKSTDNVVGMREMKDLQAKAAAARPNLFMSLARNLVKAERSGQVDLSKLKNTGFYIRQAEGIWQWLKKAEEDTLNFEGACLPWRSGAWGPQPHVCDGWVLRVQVRTGPLGVLHAGASRPEALRRV
jgi:hypothetical protein